MIQELFTTRYEDLDTGFNETDYATACNEDERAIRAEKELLEAEKEAEKAAVSLKIYEDDLNERKTDIDEDLLPYLCPSSLQVPRQKSTAQTSETYLEQRTQSMV